MTSVAKYSKKLLRESIVTGIPQIVRVRGCKRKFGKALVFLLCVLGFLYQTSKFMKVYWTYPTVVYIVHAKLPKVYLPAITICSHNGINSSIFCEEFPELCTPFLDYKQFCRTSRNFCPDINAMKTKKKPVIFSRSFPRLNRSEYRKFSLRADQIIQKCTVYGTGEKETDCTDDVTWIPVYDARGIPNSCYVFNSLWGNIHGKLRPIGRRTKIYLSIKAVREDLFFDHIPRSLQVSIHSPFSIVNPFHGGFIVSRCYEYYVYVSKIRKIMQPAPYSTNCTDYMDRWRKSGGKSPLTRSLCTDECVLKESLKLHDCVDSMQITYPTNATMCTTNVSFDDVYAMCYKDRCQSACEFEKLLLNVQEQEFTKSQIDVSQCVTAVRILFDHMEETHYQYYPKYESIELFSYIGGYLGVWLGISLIAVFDFLEFVGLTFAYYLKRSKSTQIQPNYMKSQKHAAFKAASLKSVTVYY